MARRRRTRRVPTYSCGYAGLGSFQPGAPKSFARQSVEVAGSLIVGKLILWGAAIALLKFAATRPGDVTTSQVSEALNRIAAPPQFLAANFLPANVKAV